MFSYVSSMQDYRNLHVWQRAHDHAIGVRKATRRFPRSGCGSRSQKEFVRFLDISIKSSFELEYQLKLANGYEVLGNEAWKSLSDETIEIRKMLCGLSAKVENSIDNP